MFGFGRVIGPYHNGRKNLKSGEWNEICYFQLGNFEHVQAAVAMMWRWLSREKKDQAIRALRLMPGQRRRRINQNRLAWKAA